MYTKVKGASDFKLPKISELGLWLKLEQAVYAKWNSMVIVEELESHCIKVENDIAWLFGESGKLVQINKDPAQSESLTTLVVRFSCCLIVLCYTVK